MSLDYILHKKHQQTYHPEAFLSEAERPGGRGSPHGGGELRALRALRSLDEKALDDKFVEITKYLNLCWIQ